MRVRKCNEKTVQGTMRDDDDDVDDVAHSVFVLFFFLVLGFRSRFGVRVTRSRRCSAPATWVDGRVGRAGRGREGFPRSKVLGLFLFVPTLGSLSFMEGMNYKVR